MMTLLKPAHRLEGIPPAWAIPIEANNAATAAEKIRRKFSRWHTGELQYPKDDTAIGMRAASIVQYFYICEMDADTYRERLLAWEHVESPL